MSTRFLFLLLLIFCISGYAQDYTIKMKMGVTGLPKEYAGMGDQDITTFIKGNKTKTIIEGPLASSTVFFDGDALLLMSEDAMGNKQAFKAGKEELESTDHLQKEEKPEIIYTKETKKILGYVCRKAIVKAMTKQQGEMKITVWLSDKIKAPRVPTQGNNSQMFDFSALDGHALEMEMLYQLAGQDFVLSMTTKSINTKAISDQEFIPDTKGFEVLPFAEWKKKYQPAKK